MITLDNFLNVKSLRHPPIKPVKVILVL